jgi:hypothetical protein
MQFSPASCHFVHLRPKYSKEPVLKHLQSVVFRVPVVSSSSLLVQLTCLVLQKDR